MDKLVQIKNLIYEIRGFKVMLDSDLAMLYEVETKALNRAVKRNIERFPKDFMFQLTKEEWENLRCHFGTSSSEHGGRRFMPYVFTEQGVSMLSSVLKSARAIQINVEIMRTFVKLRELAIDNKDMAQRLAELKHYFMQHCKDNETDIRDLKQAMDLLMDRTKPDKIGFRID